MQFGDEALPRCAPGPVAPIPLPQRQRERDKGPNASQERVQSFLLNKEKPPLADSI